MFTFDPFVHICLDGVWTIYSTGFQRTLTSSPTYLGATCWTTVDHQLDFGPGSLFPPTGGRDSDLLRETEQLRGHSLSGLLDRSVLELLSSTSPVSVLEAERFAPFGARLDDRFCFRFSLLSDPLVLVDRGCFLVRHVNGRGGRAGTRVSNPISTSRFPLQAWFRVVRKSAVLSSLTSISRRADSNYLSLTSKACLTCSKTSGCGPPSGLGVGGIPPAILSFVLVKLIYPNYFLLTILNVT